MFGPAFSLLSLKISGTASYFLQHFYPASPFFSKYITTIASDNFVSRLICLPEKRLADRKQIPQANEANDVQFSLVRKRRQHWIKRERERKLFPTLISKHCMSLRVRIGMKLRRYSPIPLISSVVTIRERQINQTDRQVLLTARKERSIPISWKKDEIVGNMKRFASFILCLSLFGFYTFINISPSITPSMPV